MSRYVEYAGCLITERKTHGSGFFVYRKKPHRSGAAVPGELIGFTPTEADARAMAVLATEPRRAVRR